MNIGAYLSNRRSQLMGLAALLTVCFHSYADLPFKLWDYVVNTNGNMGVDFFVLLSGFGCAYALERSGDLRRYYARRLRRLLPAYYVTLLLSLIVVAVPKPVMLAAHVLPISVWTGHSESLWYVAAALVYYALVPLFYYPIRNARWPRVVFFLLLFCLLVPLPIATWDGVATIALSRLPALLTGVYLGIVSQRERGWRDWALDIGLLVLLHALGFVFMLDRWNLGAMFDYLTEDQCSRLQKDLRAPLLMVIAAAALEGLSHTPFRRLDGVLNWLGRHSLDIYLAHLLVRDVGRDRLGLSELPLLLFMLALSPAVGYAIHRVAEEVLNLWDGLLPRLRRSDAL